MSLFEIFLIGCGLAMDAFALSCCKGSAVPHVSGRHMCAAGVWFGAFQILMALAGYFLAGTFAKYIQEYDHWIAFVLLCAAGVIMFIKAARGLENEKQEYDPFAAGAMLKAAVSAGIGTFAAGIVFCFLKVNIWLAADVAGVAAFALSAAGVKTGSVFGVNSCRKAEAAGGAVIIIVGLRVLLSHFGIIDY
ncbi:MAG: manganese efflux pump MntP family protein [Anaerovoracaceae bacterium]|jgi:putative Mn2+ efflux pump MntP